MDVHLRDADIEDAPFLADVCLLADRDTLGFLLEGLRPNMPVADLLTRLCRTEDTPYSYRHFTVAVDDDQIVGGISVIPAPDTRRLDEHLADALHGLGLGIVGVLRWFVRRLRLASRSKALALPDNCLLIGNVAVLPAYQGMGVGRRLVEHAVEAAGAGGFDSVCLFVWQDRDGAVRFYERNGFEVANAAKFRPHPRLPHEGRYLMQRALGTEQQGDVKRGPETR